jgi:DNA-directed RNA polymerase specialized sigma24 family protein
MERHGLMVLHACRGTLRDQHDAMDAFQATFLILVRKGGSLWRRRHNNWGGRSAW